MCMKAVLFERVGKFKERIIQHKYSANPYQKVVILKTLFSVIQ